MAVKKVELEGIGPVTLVKSAQNRNLRLSVTSDGVRVSMPRWTPYAAGANFAAANAAWIRQERTKQQVRLLESGQAIGKQHHIRFEHVFGPAAPRTRVTSDEVIVQIGRTETEVTPAVQQRARRTIARALKKEADDLLPPRLKSLATEHDYQYASVHIKALKRRWGSCSSQQAITLNLYLMELPWEAIDYVLLHELTHTRHMHHGPEFWQAMEARLPGARRFARELRRRQPK